LARTVNEIHGDLLFTFPTPALLFPPSRDGTLSSIRVFLPWRRRPTRTEENVARVKRLVEDNPRMTTRQVVATFPTIYNCFQACDGGSRAPKPPQRAPNKTQRVKCCQDLLKLFQDHGEDFLGSHLLVQDEYWFYWDSADPTGGRFLTPLCETDSEEDDDSDGVHLQAEAADRNTMIEYLRTTGKRFLSLKKDKIRLKDCLLMWDNARPHTATDTREFLTWRDVEPVKQSHYSPDLNLFKAPAREDEFGGHEEATLAVQRAMMRVSEDELYDQLRKLWGHYHDVITVGGDCVY
ncbi:Uncharacterized protein FKW44_025356, partial [Caligus rogercresseyi]